MEFKRRSRLLDRQESRERRGGRERQGARKKEIGPNRVRAQAIKIPREFIGSFFCFVFRSMARAPADRNYIIREHQAAVNCVRFYRSSCCEQIIAEKLFSSFLSPVSSDLPRRRIGDARMGFLFFFFRNDSTENYVEHDAALPSLGMKGGSNRKWKTKVGHESRVNRYRGFFAVEFKCLAFG